MARRDSIDLFGATALTGFSFLLGVNQVVVKLSNDGFSPVFQAGIRSLGAALVLICVMYLRAKPLHMPAGGTVWGVVLGALFGAEFICLFLALDMTTVSRASVLFYTMPVWLSLAAHFLIPGERIGLRSALGLVLAVSGVVLALADRSDGTRSLMGDTLALVSSLGWAAIALVVRTTPAGRAAPETQLLWQLAVSAPIMLVAALFFGPFIRDLSWTHLAGLSFQILIVINMGFVMWFWLMTIYPASGVASFSFLSPIFSVLLGWLLLGEDVSSAIWASLVLVATGIALINWPTKRPVPPA